MVIKKSEIIDISVLARNLWCSFRVVKFYQHLYTSLWEDWRYTSFFILNRFLFALQTLITWNKITKSEPEKMQKNVSSNCFSWSVSKATLDWNAASQMYCIFCSTVLIQINVLNAQVCTLWLYLKRASCAGMHISQCPHRITFSAVSSFHN